MPIQLDRMTRRADYLRLGQNGRKAVTAGFVLQAADAPATSPCGRIGFTASRKVGKAVDRNRARRRLKELARLHFGALAETQTDYVLIARAAAVRRPFTALIKDLKWAARRVHSKKSAP